jgi:hypothetical protein
MNIFFLSEMLHHKVSDLRLGFMQLLLLVTLAEVSLEDAPTSNPSDSSLASSIP